MPRTLKACLCCTGFKNKSTGFGIEFYCAIIVHKTVAADRASSTIVSMGVLFLFLVLTSVRENARK